MSRRLYRESEIHSDVFHHIWVGKGIQSDLVSLKVQIICLMELLGKTVVGARGVLE